MATLLAALAVLVGWPLRELFSIAAEELAASGPSVLGGVPTRAAAINSAWLALVVGGAAVLGGAAAAFVTERSTIPGRKWLRIGFLLPLLIPPFVSAMGWVRAYGPSGLVDDSLGFSLPGLLGPAGVAAVISINAMPVAYLIIAAALNSAAGTDAERSARISGARARTALATVTVPMLAPALLAGGLLSAVVALNSFGVPAVLGTPSGFTTVTTRIYQDLARSARPESFARAVLLAGALVIAALALSVAAEVSLGRHGSLPRTAGPSGPARVAARSRQLPIALAWGFVLFATIVPLAAISLVGLTRAVGLAPVPANWTLANFGEALTPRFVGALGRSLVLSIAAASGALLLGGLAATIRRGRGGRLVGPAVLLTFALPGSTLAVAVLLAYGRALRDTMLIILIAYLAKLWAIGHRSVLGSIGNLPPELTWAARTAGAGSFTAVRTVTVPLLRPALFGGWLVVFLFSFHELTMSSLLYGPGTDTLAVSILNLQQVGDVGVSSALAVLLTIPLVVAAIPLLAAGRLSRRLLGTE